MVIIWIGEIYGSVKRWSAVLTIGILLLVGCGRNDDADTVKHVGHESTDAAERAKTDRVGQADTELMEQQEENSLTKWETELEAGTPANLTAEAFRGVAVVRDGEPYFAVSYEPRVYKNSFDCWAISVPYRSMATVDTEAMYEYFRILTDMELTAVHGITREEAGLEDVTDTVFVAYYSGQTEEGGQAEPDRGIMYRFGGQDEEGNYYVETAGKIWLADMDTAERIFAVDPYECVLKVVSVVSVETVSKVSIEFSGSQYEMKIDDGIFWWNGKEVESSGFYALYTELMSVFIEKELLWEEQEKIDAANRELLMSVIYERNMEGAPRITQRYYAYDEEYASVQVNGTEYFLVSRNALEQLQKMIMEAF